MSFLFKRKVTIQSSPSKHRSPSTFSTVSARLEGRVEDVLDIMIPPEFQPENNLAAASSSVIQFYPEWCQCFQCIARKEKTNEKATCMDSFREALLCPPTGPFARVIEFIVLITALSSLLWLLFWDFDPEEETPSPGSFGGPIFALFCLEVCGLFLGIFMKCIGLPSLLGPLLLGIALRNIEAINLFRNFEGWKTRNCYQMSSVNATNECLETAVRLSSNWIKPIRQIALTLILSRAGLELSPKQLKKLKGVVPLLAFGPCIIEACFCASMIYLLFNVFGDVNNRISIPMCFVAGFALAAVSPAVVVPGMLSLKKKGYGVDQGVPTLLIAASSIDDVLAISAYTICLGIAVTGGHDKGSEWEIFASGPIGLVVGIVHGIVVGSFLHFIPAKHSSGLAVNRLILLLLFNFVSLFAYELEEIVEGAGSLAVLVTSFIASFGWRSERHWKKPMHELEHYLAHLWTLFVPLLFGTIGREVDFSSPGFTAIRVGKIMATIVSSLIIRCAVTFLIVGMAKLNYKERLFCSLSWIPKATVQAALAPLVLSKITSTPHADYLEQEKLMSHGKIVVTTAVLAILLTAPLGSVLISLCGPKLLRKTLFSTNAEIEKEFPHGEGDPEVVDDYEIFVLSGDRSGDRRLSTRNSIFSGSGSSGGDGVKVLLYPEGGATSSIESVGGLAASSNTSLESSDSANYEFRKGFF